jgi:hypothetical protein
MPATVVGLFRTRIEADRALGKLKEAGFGPDRSAISTPQFRRRGRYAGKVLVGIVIGVLASMGASGDQALFYEQEVESGRILIRVSGPVLERAWDILRAAGAMEAAPVEAPLERPRPESG